MKNSINTSPERKPRKPVLRIYLRFNKEELFINCASVHAGIPMNTPHTFMYIKGYKICSNWTELMSLIGKTPKDQRFSLVRELITQLKPM